MPPSIPREDALGGSQLNIAALAMERSREFLRDEGDFELIDRAEIAIDCLLRKHHLGPPAIHGRRPWEE